MTCCLTIRPCLLLTLDEGNARSALQSLRYRCSAFTVTGSDRPLLESGGSFRVFDPRKYHPYCFCDPALPLALAPAVRSSFRWLPPMTVWVIGCILSSSFHLPLEYYPATPTQPPQRSGPLMGFDSLQHLRHPRSTHRGLSLPATFRLQGLITLLTAYSLDCRAGFVSHRRRSWDSPFGGFPFQMVSTAFRPRTNPHTVSPAVFPPPKRQTGPKDLGFWVLTTRKCLAAARRFKPATTSASHGFGLSRACHENLGLDFSKPPLSRFAGPSGYPPNPPAP
jgi:hypothetical protein